MTAWFRSAIASLLLCSLPACDESDSDRMNVPNSDASAGAVAIRNHGCGSCHVIPGIFGANATVGPPLHQYARRVYVAGMLPNEPENLVRWIRHPRQIKPQTAMPDMNIGPKEARDIAAYLYSSTR